MGVGIGEAICKLHSIGTGFEEVWELELEASSSIFIIIVWLRIADFGAPSSPLGALAILAEADLHARIIQASSFCETFDNEFYLSLQPLTGEVEPCGSAIGVHFFGELDLVDGWRHFLHRVKIPWLKVAAEERIADSDDLGITRYIFSLFFLVEDRSGLVPLGTGWHHFQSGFFGIGGSGYLLGYLVCSLDLSGAWVGQVLFCEFLKLPHTVFQVFLFHANFIDFSYFLITKIIYQPILKSPFSDTIPFLSPPIESLFLSPYILH